MQTIPATHYLAIVNTPGYLPMDDDPAAFETTRDAWQYLVSEVDRAWDDYPDDENGACVEAHSLMHYQDQSVPGSVYAPTPGYDGDHDLGVAYSVVVCDCGDSLDSHYGAEL